MPITSRLPEKETTWKFRLNDGLPKMVPPSTWLKLLEGEPKHVTVLGGLAKRWDGITYACLYHQGYVVLHDVRKLPNPRFNQYLDQEQSEWLERALASTSEQRKIIVFRHTYVDCKKISVIGEIF